MGFSIGEVLLLVAAGSWAFGKDFFYNFYRFLIFFCALNVPMTRLNTFQCTIPQAQKSSRAWVVPWAE